MSVQTIEAKLALAANQFNRAIDGAIGKLDTLESKSGAVNKAVKGLGGGAALGAGLALGKGASDFADFDSAMTESQAIMGDVSDDMDKKMSDAAREVGRTTSHSAEDAAESFYYLASAGLDAKESTEQLGGVADFAQAGMFDMATATDILTDANSALGNETGEMTGLGDQLVQANQQANASVEQFGESLKNKAAPAMKRMGVESEEGIAALSVFADQGLKGRRAGTIFARTLEGLESNARTNKDAFEELGVSVTDQNGEMRDMEDIVADMEGAMAGMSTAEKNAALEKLGFNKRAKQGIDLLMGNSDELGTYKDNLEDAGGSTKEVARKQLDTFNAQLGLLKDRLHDVSLSIGSAVLPVLNDLLKPLNEAVLGFAKWAEEADNAQKVAKTLAVIMGAGIVAAIGGLSAPVWAAAAAVAALAAAWRTNFASIRDQTMRVVDVFRSEFGPVVSQLQDTFSAVIDAIAPKAESGMGRIESAMTPVIELFANVLIAAIRGAAGGIMTALQAIESIAEGTFDWNSVIPGTAGVLNTIAGKLSTFAGIAGTHMSAAAAKVRSLIPSFSTVKSAVVTTASFIGTKLASIGTAFATLATTIGGHMLTAGGKIRSILPPFATVKNTVTTVATIVGTTLATLATKFATFATLVGTHMGTAAGKVRTLLPSFATVRNTVTTVSTVIGTKLGVLATKFATFAGLVGTHMGTAAGKVRTLLPSFTTVKNTITTVSGIIGAKLGVLATKFATFAGLVGTHMGTAGGKVRSILPSFNTVKSTVATVVGFIVTKLGILKNGISVAVGIIASKLDGGAGGALQRFKLAVGGMVSFVKTKLALLPVAFGLLKDSLLTAFNLMKPGFDKVKLWFQGLGLSANDAVRVIGVAALKLLGPFGTIIGLVASLAARFDLSFANIKKTVLNTLSRITGAILTRKGEITTAVTTLLSTLASLFTQYLLPIAALVFRVFNQIKTIIVDTLEHLINTVFIPFLGQVLGLWETHGAQLIEEFILTFNVLLQRLKPILQAIKIAIALVLEALKVIWDTWGEEIMTVVEFVFDFISQIVITAMDGLLTGIRVVLALIRGDWSKAWNLMAGFLKRTLDRILSFVTEWVPKLLNVFVTVLADIIQAFVNFGKKLIFGSIIPEIFNEIFTFITELMGKIFDKISTVLQKILDKFVEILGLIFEKVTTFYTDLFEKVATQMKKVFDKIAEVLQKIFDKYVEILGLIFEKVSTFYTDLFEKVSTKMGEIFTKIKKTLQKIFDKYVEILGLIFEKVTTFYSDLFEKVSTKMGEIFTKIKKTLQKILDKYVEILGLIFEKVSTFYSDLFEKVSTKMGEIFTKIKKSLDKIFKKFKNIFSDILEKAGNFGSDLFEEISNSLSDVLTEVGEWSDDVYNDIKGMVEDITGWISDTGSDLFSNAFDAIASAGVDAFNAVIPDQLHMPEATIGGGSVSLPSVKIAGNRIGGGSLNIPTLDVGGESWNLPQLAEGGIAMDDTIAQIGEGGEPEVVAPLSKLESMLSTPKTDALDEAAREPASDTPRSDVVAEIRALREALDGMDAEINEAEIEVGEDGLLRFVNGQIEFKQERDSINSFSRNTRS